MSSGGALGFFCNHQYAHAHDAGRKSIPAAFKGVDLAVFTAFHSLGLNPTVRPVLKDQDHKSLKWGGLTVEELFKLKDVNAFNKKMSQKMNVGNSEYDSDEYDSEDYDPDVDELRTVVGTNMHGVKTQDYYNEGQKVSYFYECLYFRLQC